MEYVDASLLPDSDRVPVINEKNRLKIRTRFELGGTYAKCRRMSIIIFLRDDPVKIKFLNPCESRSKCIYRLLRRGRWIEVSGQLAAESFHFNLMAILFDIMI